MKSFKIYTAGLVSLLSLGLLFSSCEKSSDGQLVTQSNLNNRSLIRVFVATVNASRNYVYVDGDPVTGALLSSGSMFPASGVYAASIPAGLKAFLVRDTLATTMQIPLSFAENMQVNKNYSIFMYDTINAPKQKTVLTVYEIPADTTCRIRFANFIYNPTIVPAIDIFSFNRNVNIFTNVAVTDVTNFIPYPTNTTPDTLYIRETGSTTNIIKLSVGNFFREKRSYTLVYRGSHRGTRVGQIYTDR
ncbi:MAG: hypothetical protein SGI83_13940 [Bacteroidota bacterium]|nr:hypothetical protein [Bacteroidota bacterium]